MSNRRRSVGEQVRGGLVLTGKIVLGGVCLFAVGVGIVMIEVRSRLPHSPALGLAVIAGVLWFALATMDHWVKAFPAVIAYGAFNALVSIGSGHLTNQPNAPLPRSEAALAWLFLAGAAAVSMRFVKTTPAAAGRAAVICYLACFVWAMASPQAGVLALGIGFAALLAAFVYDRPWRRRRRVRRGLATEALPGRSRGNQP